MPNAEVAGHEVEAAELRVRGTGALWSADVEECTGAVVRLSVEPGPLGELPALDLGTAVECSFATPNGRLCAEATVVSRRSARVWLRIRPSGVHRDRRRAARVLGGFPVEYASDGASDTGACVDISTGGMRLRVPSPLPVRTAVRLSFRLPGQPAGFAVAGSVVYTAPIADGGGCDLGVEFGDMPAACRDVLAVHCSAARRL